MIDRGYLNLIDQIEIIFKIINTNETENLHIVVFWIINFVSENNQIILFGVPNKLFKWKNNWVI